MRPRIIVNCAMTFDGKAFVPSSGSDAGEDLERLLQVRASGDALMTDKMSNNLNLALSDLLIVRLAPRGNEEFHGSRQARARKRGAGSLVIFGSQKISSADRTRLTSLGHLHLALGHSLPLPWVLTVLSRDYHVKTLICEGGLIRDLAELDLIDELDLTLVPELRGSSEAPGILGSSSSFLEASHIFSLVKMESIQDKCYLQYRRRVES
jgi:riboflavin biosynthesis pyrimidine reductase